MVCSKWWYGKNRRPFISAVDSSGLMNGHSVHSSNSAGPGFDCRCEAFCQLYDKFCSVVAKWCGGWLHRWLDRDCWMEAKRSAWIGMNVNCEEDHYYTRWFNSGRTITLVWWISLFSIDRFYDIIKWIIDVRWISWVITIFMKHCLNIDAMRATPWQVLNCKNSLIRAGVNCCVRSDLRIVTVYTFQTRY